MQEPMKDNDVVVDGLYYSCRGNAAAIVDFGIWK